MQENTANMKKFLTFRVGEEHYAVDILSVKEIIGLLPIAKVPHMSESMRGVINLRGKVIPVQDFRVSLNASNREDTEITCIVIIQSEVEGHELQVGFIVDEVSDVLSYPEDEINDSPTFGKHQRSESVVGVMTPEDGRIIMLLNMDKIVNQEEVSMMEEIEVEQS